MSAHFRTALALALLLPGCSPEPRPLPEILGVVNHEYLTTDEYLHQFTLRGGRRLEGKARRAFKRGLLAELVDRALLLQECRRRRIRPARPGFKAAMRELGADGATGWDLGDSRRRWQVEDDAAEKAAIDALLAGAALDADPPTRAEADAWLARHPEAGWSPVRVRLRRIMVHSATMTSSVSRALAAGMPFGEAARRWSAASDRRSGGEMGWPGPADGPPEVWVAVRDLPAGRTAGPITTPYGTLFLRADARADAERLGRADARDRARRAILSDRRRAALGRYVERLRTDAVISLDLAAVDGL